MVAHAECSPATEADLTRLGKLFEDGACTLLLARFEHHELTSCSALGPALPAMFFPNGKPPAEQRFAWRASLLSRFYVAMTDTQQRELHGP